MPPILDAQHLTKFYGSYRALSDLTLAIQPGEVVGLLGPNGSGKTTALRSFLGFLKPTSGDATVAGYDCWHESVEVRKRVAYLPGELRLYDSMTGRQLVHFLGKLRGETPGAEVDVLAKKLDIDPDKQLTSMSSGMKRKVALLTVLLPKVPLIILDEPTNTLDPTMRDQLLEQLLLAKLQGKAILFSSHVLQEVEAICDRVAILKKGELVHLQDITQMREGRQVHARIRGTRPTTGPTGEPLQATFDETGLMRMEYTGEMPRLLEWLGRQQLSELRIEPLGLQSLYQQYHG
ncbi:MAG: ABC transporter ATP-binding protein [Fimbriiglobus sp.]